jgi:hypothetical protein
LVAALVAFPPTGGNDVGPLPELAGLHYGNAFKLAQDQEILVHGDQERDPPGYGGSKNRQIVRIAAGSGRNREGKHHLGLSLQHEDGFADHRRWHSELLQKVSRDFIQDVARANQRMGCSDFVEQLRADARAGNGCE